MDRKLYYCEPWPHKKVFVNNQNIFICISPKISGNQNGTTIQYHGIIHHDNQVHTIGALNKNLTFEQAQDVLEELEQILRTALRSNIKWKENVNDSGTIKIWYYDENETNVEMNDKRKWPPLRFTITVVNIEPIDNITDKVIQDELEQKLILWVNSVVKM